MKIKFVQQSIVQTKDCTKLLTDTQVEIIVQRVKLNCQNYTKKFSVEDVQNMVEENIMSQGAFDVARKYITYRFKRQLARDEYQNLINAVKTKMTASNIQKQNANVDEESFGGREGEAKDVLMKHYALDYIVSPLSRQNHLNNEIYIHDLNSYANGMHNCLSCPIDDLLKNGFDTKQTDVRPAQSVNTAFQLLAVIFPITIIATVWRCKCYTS